MGVIKTYISEAEFISEQCNAYMFLKYASQVLQKSNVTWKGIPRILTPIIASHCVAGAVY